MNGFKKFYWQYPCRLMSFFMLMVSGHAFAITPLTDEATEFNVKKANQQFEQIKVSLSIQNLNSAHLHAAIETLSPLVLQADQCVNEAQKKLTNIQSLIQSAQNTEKKYHLSRG